MTMMIPSTITAAATAIICQGTYFEDYHDPIQQSREYVIDDKKQTVSYFDPSTGGLAEFCDGQQTCRRSVEPLAAKLNAGTSPTDRYELNIDRQSGLIAVWDARSAGPNRIYRGQCSRTDMPTIPAIRRKF